MPPKYFTPPEKSSGRKQKVHDDDNTKKPTPQVRKKAKYNANDASKTKDFPAKKTPTKGKTKSAIGKPVPSLDTNDNIRLPVDYKEQMLAYENIMLNLQNCVQRDEILSEEALKDKSSRHNLLLIRIIQQDITFNEGNTDDNARRYTPKQCDAVLACVKALHKKYYNVDCQNDPLSLKDASKPSSTPLLHSGLKQDNEPLDADCEDDNLKSSGKPLLQSGLEQDNEPLDGINKTEPPLDDTTNLDVVVSNIHDGDYLGLPRPKKRNRPKRKRTGGRIRALYCKDCGTELIRIIMKESKPNIFWIPKTIRFEHGEVCNLRPKSIRGIEQYPVDSSVLDAAEKLKSLAKKWYAIVSDDPLKSILIEHLPGDDRFYGLFYHEFAAMVKGINAYQIMDYMMKGINFEELRDFRAFYDDIMPSQDDQKNMMEVVILFIEDFKFIKRMHSHFQDGTNFLGAVGFLAGGKTTQKLHYDVEKVPPRSRDPGLPTSILLPIGAKGRSIFFENITDARSKHHIDRGYAVWFDGNVPHAGAKSKAHDPMDNLALHIHIDSTIFFWKPNILELAPDCNEEAWDSDKESDDDQKPCAV